MTESYDSDRILSCLTSEVAASTGLAIAQVATRIPVIDLGITSLGLLKFLAHVERQFTVSFTPTEVQSLFCEDLFSLAKIIENKLA